MVKLPKNGVVLIHTRNTLYTLVISEELGMMIQGHEKYCPKFTEVEKIILYPGLAAQIRMMKADGEFGWVTTSRVKEIHVLADISDPEVAEVNFHQHEDHGDIADVMSVGGY